MRLFPERRHSRGRCGRRCAPRSRSPCSVSFHRCRVGGRWRRRCRRPMPLWSASSPKASLATVTATLPQVCVAASRRERQTRSGRPCLRPRLCGRRREIRILRRWVHRPLSNWLSLWSLCRRIWPWKRVLWRRNWLPLRRWKRTPLCRKRRFRRRGLFRRDGFRRAMPRSLPATGADSHRCFLRAEPARRCCYIP